MFLINQVLDQGLLQSVLCAYKSTEALEPRAKDSRKEVDKGDSELFRGGFFAKFLSFSFLRMLFSLETIVN